VSPIRVLVADDHPLIRVGLRKALAGFAELEIVAEATDGRAALSAVESSRPDVALIDLAMPRMDGYELIARIKENVACVALTSSMAGEDLERALEAGALSVLTKSVPASVIAEALRAAVEGRGYWENGAAELVLRSRSRRRKDADPFSGLTGREREVMAMLGSGLTNDEIATELGLSRKTVKVHVGNLLAKTGTTDRTKLAVLYWRSGANVTDGGAAEGPGRRRAVPGPAVDPRISPR
jgi:two-component system, NarL family, response regulator LiaR